MRRLIVFSAVASLLTSIASAEPGFVTASINFRSGPGTGFKAIGRIAEGVEVDVKDCDSGGTWCAITFNGTDGFVGGQYIARPTADTPAWPRVYTTDQGAALTLFQPQITEWKDFRDLKALVAAEYRPTKGAAPLYGVIEFSAKTVADDETDVVTLTDVTTTGLNFSTLAKEQLADLALEVGKLVPTDPITISQSRLTTSLADYQRLGNVENVKSDAPPIFVSEQTAILVQTDGKAVASPVKGVDGLSFVVNTNWDLFKVDAENAYYLRDEKSWLKSSALDGEWTPVDSLPDVLSKLPADDNWKDAKAAMPPAPFADGGAPKVVYSDAPAELIVFQGKPALEKVEGTGLEWASNTTSDVFFYLANKNWYVLLSGRWFASKSLQGPWTFATPSLPEDFQNIPASASYASVRSSIPGTSESAEARLKASIPQMARVATDGSVKVDVAYSGDPKFEPIDGTSLTYAVNSNEEVIKVGSKYFVLKDGIWFEGDSPTGPFSVAKAVPDKIYKIPPSSPVYNVTYVRIYDSEPDSIWYGYTAGYLGAYLAWDALVWGTGWVYPAYWDLNWRDGYWPYYPRPVTYGVGAFYNPAYGTFGRYGYAYGPYRGIAGGAAYNPRTGAYIRGGAISGPAGSRGFVSAYNPRTGNAFAAHGGQNVYGSWGSASVKHGSNFAHISGGQTAAGAGVHWRNSQGDHGFIASGKGSDVYAGRDGNVYRRDDGQWQKHTSDGWQPVNKPNSENLKNAGQQFAAKHPDAADQIRQKVDDKPAAAAAKRRQTRDNAPEHLGLDRAGRQFGNQRDLGRDFGRRDLGNISGGGAFRGGGNFGRREFHGGGGGHRLMRR